MVNVARAVGLQEVHSPFVLLLALDPLPTGMIFVRGCRVEHREGGGRRLRHWEQK